LTLKRAHGAVKLFDYFIKKKFSFDTVCIRIHFLRHEFYRIPLAADCLADLLEHFHDVRVVWPFEMIETCSTGLRIWLKFLT
jgi:hypothetical protein